ncbi:hypothetical protein BRARA_C03469 [Brassica rapa]|uniref:YTH domain-containing family protein n=1 Tax=Brassica campestris TaxID=3711 RepID=A0A398A8N2_BRACM|nr:hypothetical protein BRARA_C03469 [Brassica rapa]CAG7882484.1 unnamed protein product [Brassica rapa]VDC81756.1 unnamed protein product [Brassica rapa]
MATVASSPADQSADMLQNLSLDSQPKAASEIPEPKKTAVYQYGGVDLNGQVPSFDRSLTPLLPSDAVDPSVCYVPNAYQQPFYYGYGTGDWSEYTGYQTPEGVDMTSGYGYAAYPYSPATSPAPQVGGDGQLYGAQQYQYPAFFPTGSFASSVATPTQGDLAANKAGGLKPAESKNVASAAGMAKGSNGSAAGKPNNQTAFNTSSNMYGNGATAGGYAAGYQDARFNYDGYYGTGYSDVQRPVASSYSKANSVTSSRNQNYRSNSNYTGVHQPASMTGYGTHGYYSKMYQSKLYGNYGSSGRSGMGYSSSGYDSRTNGRGWGSTTDSRYRGFGRGNSFFYGNENNADGLNELNRGPRARGAKNQKENSEDSLEVKEQTSESNVAEAVETENTCIVPDREQYNKEDFPVDYASAMFFVIKSYSEDDVHKSIKYNVWASTPNGNKKLAAAYQEAQQKPGGCPIFLFFSVNASGQFVGLAEMTGPVDFDTNVDCWQQDKWTGSFPLKWHIVKDVPNSLLKHITLENNENKPVTNSRDTQEVKLEQGLKIVKIFKEHTSKTCILDDFSFYEVRQKTILEKKAKQHQTQKQVSEEKTTTDEKKETATADSANKESPPAAQTTGDVKVDENGSVAKPVGVVANGC